ncbi:MAG: radical SAM protein [Phycisphaerae bacterium]|nr:radical SAM protein [Phycisphaerae bacterium]
MPSRPVVLVNSNEMKPPVAPLALDYIGGRLEASGFEPKLVDLSFSPTPEEDLARALSQADPIAVGVTFRNSDDCFWPSCGWFVPRLREIVDVARRNTSAPIVLGGCGFSIFPSQIMDRCGVDLGVVGDGEDVMLTLAQRMSEGRALDDVPGLAQRDRDGRIVVIPPRFPAVLDLTTSRRIVDNPRYLRTGAMGNIETKRGCPNQCIYCADPVAKGRRTRCRDPRQIADEVESLLAQGVDILHLCDAEFNVPGDHAMAVCQEIIARKLGDRLCWYCYATVQGFSADLALAMRRAGCVGINFGVDACCDRMLEVYRRGYDRQAVKEAVEHCRRAGITVMLDLLLGGPGETPDSARETIEFVKVLNPDRAGAATGIRLYPGTPMADILARQGPMHDNPSLYGNLEDNDDFLRPVFYMDRRLGENPPGLIRDLIGQDERFFKPAPMEGMVDYNYNDNTELEEAIARGHRGAFWDIFRRLSNDQAD